MTEWDDWPRVRALYHAALDQSEHARSAWLENECAGNAELFARVRSLLATSGTEQDFLDGPVGDLLQRLRTDEDVDELGIGAAVGPYRLQRLLGVGGMGRVYLAERVDGQFRQLVALKLIRSEFANPQLRQRFLRERDTLARLTHPHIAQLHDGGIGANGAPYFTLEYIEGKPITIWCDDRTLGLRARIVLFLKVCAAVEYAHRNLIVHRDIKPSNILVTADGEPKLLDFGIAKPLAADSAALETGTQAHPMTREYAAPEQVLGEPITTATDVYSLGILLYLLLCGRMPYRRASLGETGWTKSVVEEVPEALERALARPLPTKDDATPHVTSSATVEQLATQRATSPLQLKRELRGDLERIVQNALAKSPETRYPNVSALVDDLRTYLEGRPLRGGHWRYRLAKFLRRHRVGVAAASVAALLTIAGVSAIVWQARETARQARTVIAVKDFLLSLFNASDPNAAKGRDISARELIDRGNAQIEHGLAREPALRAELQGTLGRIYFELGFYDQAQTLQQSALALTQPGNAATLDRELADTLIARGDLAGAGKLAEQASALLDEGAANDDARERIRVLITRSSIAQRNGASADAQKLAHEAAALARTDSDAEVLLGNALSAEGLAEWDLRDAAKSEALYREALQIHRDVFGDTDLRVATDRQNLTLALRNLGRYDEALDQARRNVAIREQILGPTHPELARALDTLGTTLYHMGAYPEAEKTLRRSVDIARIGFGEDNPTTAISQNNLALLLMDWHGLAEAERVLTQALAIDSAKLGPRHYATLILSSNLAEVHARQNKLELAENELRDVLARDESAGIRDRTWELFRLGDVRRRRGDWQEAIVLNRQALEQAQALFAPNSRHCALAHYYLGLALADSGAVEEAEQQLRAVLTAQRSLLAPDGDHPLTASASLALAKLVLRRTEGRAEGVELLRHAVALRKRFLGDDDERTRDALDVLAGAERKL